MSRRERISDFTRSTYGRSYSDTRSRSPKRVVNGEPSTISAKLKPRTKNTYIDIKRSKSTAKPGLPRQNKSRVLRRQGLKRLPPFVPRKVKRHPLKWAALACFIVVISGTFIGAIHSRTKNNQSKAEVKALTDSKPKAPDEDRPSKEVHSAYKVDNATPRYLRSSRLDIDARIKIIGSSENGLESPENIYDVGWYESSDRPGSGGVTLIAGNVAGPNKEGIFRRIGSVKVGDVFEIEMGDGTIHKYKVITTKTFDIDKLDMAELLKPIQPGKEGLNLVTITHRFDIRAEKFEQRFAVFAIQE